ncbi:MAG: NADP-dependent malic enzyme [Candidatus Lokiarchaeota archaeon]|nr:NADP-dependent malic enzyme [Candidatus Lokiarchaeota archaeon]
MGKLTKEELLEKAKKPSIDAMRLHPFYKGKIETGIKCCLRNFDDFSIWYTPGVAKPCLDIKDHPEMVYEHTNKANTVAVVSNGTRVLGLGDIGPLGAMPVMEGKALLFKYLGGVDAFPICLDTKDPEKVIETVRLIQPSFGGINLEDIEKPECFYILDTLRKDPKMTIPVFHDDQQGTAAITLAGLINALKIVGKKIQDVQVVFNGAGAANVAIYRLLVAAGVKPDHSIITDSKGILCRKDEALKSPEPYKFDLACQTNPGCKTGNLGAALKGADVLISAGANGPGALKIPDIKGMATNSIVFACENPIPGMWPWEATEAGVKVFATGRSDFEGSSQINNSLGFPAIFRGTLDVQARTITDEMCIAAANEIAKVAEEKGKLNPGYIVPTMDEWELFPREAVAVAMKAMEQGVARLKKTRKELFEHAESVIKRSRDMVTASMKSGFIKSP